MLLVRFVVLPGALVDSDADRHIGRHLRQKFILLLGLLLVLSTRRRLLSPGLIVWVLGLLLAGERVVLLLSVGGLVVALSGADSLHVALVRDFLR